MIFIVILIVSNNAGKLQLYLGALNLTPCIDLFYQLPEGLTRFLSPSLDGRFFLLGRYLFPSL